MILSLYLFLAVNLIFIISFALGKWVVFKIKGYPNLIAGYALYLGVLFVVYFFSILAVVTSYTLVHRYLAILLLLFIFFPFWIGEKATYKKLDLYSSIQLLFLVLSFIFGIYLLKF